MFIQVLRASTVASTHRNLGRQLVDGHWVLSFPDAEAAETARNLVDQHQVRHVNIYSSPHIQQCHLLDLKDCLGVAKAIALTLVVKG